jgi:uncharacterized protein YbjQ (UPF0145 family)
MLPCGGQPKNCGNFNAKIYIMVDQQLITTSNQLEGYRITKHLGMVRGITVRSRSIFGNIGAGLQSLVGGKISIYVELCEKTRQEAFEDLVRHANDRGANAIINVRYDANEVSQGITEVLCYGTAVQVVNV